MIGMQSTVGRRRCAGSHRMVKLKGRERITESEKDGEEKTRCLCKNQKLEL